jgi:DNA polymerase/3'-5' exonuclease PolX
VGPVKAKQLVLKGITSIAQLRAELVQNPALLNDKQTTGLTYYEPLLERIPYEEMKDHEEILMMALHEVDPMIHGDVVGSFRRSAAHSGDIDLLVKGNVDIHAIVSALGDVGYLLEILALGKNKCMAICTLGTPRRLDILVTPDEEYAYALLYFTGSQQFNIAFRSHALYMGYTLNEHGLKPIKPVKKDVPYMKTERDIFHFLTLTYVEPRHRHDVTNLTLLK